MSQVPSILMWCTVRRHLTGMYMSMVRMPMLSPHSPILCGGIGVSRQQVFTTVGVRRTTIPIIRAGIMIITICIIRITTTRIIRITTMPDIIPARYIVTTTGLAAAMARGLE